VEKREINIQIIKKISIVFFTLIGFLTTIKLAMIYYDANFNPYALPSFCSINEFVDCDGVAQTVHSQFFGIPLAYWGMFLYIFITFLIFVEQIKKNRFLGFLKVFKNPLAYISALGFISFIISMILACVSIFKIKKVCLLCLCTYFINLLIAIVATDFKSGFYGSFKTSFNDFVEAIKIKKYLISSIILAILAGLFLIYTNVSFVFAPQVKRYKEFKKYEKMQNDNPFKTTGNILGDKNSNLTVYIYTDYRCPICRTYNVITSKAALELSGFKIIHKNLPLDSECNKNVPTQFHEGACMLARYAIAAEKQGRFWDLNSELFEKQPKTEKDVLKLTASMGFNNLEMEKDVHSKATTERLEKDIDNAIDLNIDGTPTIVINGKVYSGIKPYYELREILIKSGAKPRG
jgi:protein-disulfide isomerase/uncharacterized membrane protein